MDADTARMVSPTGEVREVKVGDLVPLMIRGWVQVAEDTKTEEAK